MPIGSTKATRKYPGLPSPGDTVESHTVFLRAVKEALEVHERRTKDILSSFVRVKEMDDLDFIDVRGTQIVRATLNVPTDGEDDQVLTFSNGAATWAAAAVSSGGGGGVSDHGALTGLTDDDHTQYVLRDILTTNGDIFVRLSGVVSRLGVGSEGDHLEIVSGLPAWNAPSGGGGGGGGLDFASLETEIESDSPDAFWKLDEAFGSTSLADDTGNGNTLTAVSTASHLSCGMPMNGAPSQPCIHMLPSAGTASIQGSAAVGSPPWSGDVTLEVVCEFIPIGSGIYTLFEHAASGETAGTNVQFAIYVSAVGVPQYFHEYSGGSDERHSFDCYLPQGQPLHLIFSKDSATKTVTLYVNGEAVDTITYTNETTGGTSGVPRLIEGIGDGGSNSQYMLQSYTALYTTQALDATQANDHAAALFGTAL